MNTRYCALVLTMAITVTAAGWLVFSRAVASASSGGREVAASEDSRKNGAHVQSRAPRPSVGSRKPQGDEIAGMVGRIDSVLKVGDAAEIDQVLSALLPKLMEIAPSRAAALAESLEAGRWRVDMLRRVSQQWAERDLVAARCWSERLSDREERDLALTGVCFQMAKADPSQAVEQAEKYGLSGQPGELFHALVQEWATRDLPGAAAWINVHPEGDQKDRLVARMAMVLAETSPAGAARMVADELPEGDVQTECAMSVLHQWAGQDLPGARAWVELFPEGELRERALGELGIVEQFPKR